MKITKTICRKVLQVVDAGLCEGKGKPVPGSMCVEAAVTYALGEEFSDQPSCVSPALCHFKIALNDNPWSSSAARAKGLRRIAIAQLGTKGTLDESEFLRCLQEMTIRKIVPLALRAAAQYAGEESREALLTAAQRCEDEGTKESAAAAAAYASAAAAAYASAAAAAAYASAAAAAYASAAAAAAYAAAAAAAAAYIGGGAAYAAAAYGLRAYASAAAYDEVLSQYAESVTQILIDMKTPGSKFLSITEQ